MKKMTTNEIRNMYLDFFASKAHKIEESASLIPFEDPTLLWINAGVAPLKKYFDGSEIPLNPRITNAQKSLRTNDIENVGLTARHHTFFEMLGNFSIGDYFKEEAIEYGFELLTSKEYFAFDLEKLYFTVYPTDIKTKEKWLSLGVKETQIIALEENFWEIGEGPCGPCTEIFYDRGEEFDTQKIGIKLLEEDIENDRYIEIWNIVFSQYNSTKGLQRKEYPQLPAKNIDTGMGLERMACILQDVKTNYETDGFMPIIKEISKKFNIEYNGQTSFKVIADHIRTLTFTLSDGAYFSNEGRGYVLRRILRRALRFAHSLGYTKPFMFELVKIVSTINEEYYPYLNEHQEKVSTMIYEEEVKFLKNLEKGLKKLEEMFTKSNNILSGENAFLLYDTFGFPLEVTLEVAHENNFEVDTKRFEELMSEQVTRARNARVTLSKMNHQNENLLNFTKKSEFIGYEKTEIKTKIIALFDGENFVDSLKEGFVILEKTPFYAESGGQVSDIGFLNDIAVIDVKKAPRKQHLHYVISEETLNINDEITAQINIQNRNAIKKNHSATHLLQAALKSIISNDIAQAGSNVSAKSLRFDFNFNKALTKEQLKNIENLVNEQIFKQINVTSTEMPIEEAKKLGATAIFGEKYGELVRVVDAKGFSTEFCGGTHVNNTSEIGIFKIIQETSVASGVRRIEGITSSEVYQYLENQENKLEKIALSLNTNTQQLIEKTESIVNERNGLILINENLNTKLINEEINNLKNEIIQINDLNYLVKIYKENEITTLKKISDMIKERNICDVCILVSELPKSTIIISSNNHAVDSGFLLKSLTSILGGRGGGKKEFAQGSIENSQKIVKTLQSL